MNKETHTFTQGNIIELVNHAMVKPNYLSFHNACIVVGRIINVQAREVISIYRSDKIADALIEEAMRVSVSPTPRETTGEVMVF